MKPPRCHGFLGFLFGHKFIKTVGMEYVYTSEYCFRCGFWPKKLT